MSDSYESKIYISREKEDEWKNIPDSQKKFIKNNLLKVSNELEGRAAIELLCHLINELFERMDKLEKK